MSIPLPLATESPRCSDYAREHEIEPGGTALAPEVLVLVEVPEPWPKPVAKHEDMKQLVLAAQGHPEQVRLLAAIPHDDSAPRLIVLRPTDTGMQRTERLLGIDPAAALREMLADIGGAETLVAEGAARTMLVCTQGSHDVCCGVDGAEFASAFERRRDDVEVFRVSHTGGHRFAPTAMTLPDGRMWAYLTPEVADAMIDRTAEPAIAADHCRGWWGAPTGPAQIAECAVFSLLGFELDGRRRSIEVTGGPDEYDIAVQVDREVFDVRVELGREVPTIACGAMGGQPVKPGREWRVTEGPALRSTGLR